MYTKAFVYVNEDLRRQEFSVLDHSNWDRPQGIAAETFNAIANDFGRLLPALTRTGVQLANPYGKEFPEIGPEFIGFNGAEN